LPESLNEAFTNNELALQAKISSRVARQITYCYRKSGFIQVTGKRGNAFVFQKT
jgi:hypothetical protein